jgi:hypothetical protein
MTVTKQQVFDKVVSHLFIQGSQSMRSRFAGGKPIQCAYRGEEGKSCAVGCLIADEFYSPALEGARADSMSVIQAVVKSGYSTDEIPVRMLLDLQFAHDEYLSKSVRQFLERCLLTAKYFELDTTQTQLLLNKLPAEETQDGNG